MSTPETTIKISKRTVDAAALKDRPYRIWDSNLKGFNVRIHPSGTKTYYAQYRVGGGRKAQQRSYKIGRHGVITADQARAEALQILSLAARGEDPAGERAEQRVALTIDELCDLYLAEGMGTKKASTIQTDTYRIDRHIRPLLGKKTVAGVTRSDVERFLRDVANGKTAAKPEKARKRTDPMARGGKGTATRTVRLLGGILTFAVTRGLRADNPVRGVKLYKDNQAQRFLSPEELSRLGAVLREQPADSRGAAIIRLLVFTGCRKGEIEKLRWSEIDWDTECLRLPDTKTGHKIVPVNALILDLLKALPRHEASPFVFPASNNPQKHYTGTATFWPRIAEKAGLTDVRLHDLRHTYASNGLREGLSLVEIGRLLGHKDVKTTAQYAHLAEDQLRRGVDKSTSSLARALG